MTEVLITGGASEIGIGLITTLALHDSITKIHVLTGPEGKKSDTYIFQGSRKIRVIVGNDKLPRFGIEDRVWQELRTRIDVGFNCSEPSELDLPMYKARSQQMGPLNVWMELMSINAKLRLAHLSTAYVSGRYQGLFTEFDLHCGQKFRNSYEHVKFDSEHTLQASAYTNRFVIFRPSLLVGNSVEPAAVSPMGIGHIMYQLMRRQFSIIAADPDARIDFVPVSYVVDAIITLMLVSSASSGVYHLVSGDRETVTIRDVINACRMSRSPLSTAWFAPPVLGSIAYSLTHFVRPRQNQPFHAYLRHGCTFNDYRARGALTSTGITRPTTMPYLVKLMNGADENHAPSTDMRSVSKMKATDKELH